MAAPSSDQTKPSRVARNAPASQAIRACGPPMALMTRELTTKGPIPTISIMFSATASFRPRPRSREGAGLVCGAEFPAIGIAGRIADELREPNAGVVRWECCSPAYLGGAGCLGKAAA